MPTDAAEHGRICVRCGREYPHDAAFCSADGTPLDPIGFTTPLARELTVVTDVSHGPDPESAPGRSRPAAVPTGAPPPGDVIADRFRLLRKLGAGGFGSTFVCVDQKFKRKAVLKLLHAKFASVDHVRRRFELEALALSRISHPNVVQVYDRGELPGGIPYFAMELAEGQLVSGLLKAGPLPEDDVCEIGAQLCDALQAAHTVGIIHRDLKPDNLILGQDREGRPLLKVLDFGIAAVADEAQETAVRELKSQSMSHVIGTVAYMSPEQASGERVTAGSDIYSAGVVLYHLLTGRLPAELPVTATPIGILKYVAAKPLPITQARPGISPALVAAVNRAMQKEPERRFASAAEMGSALRQAQSRPAHHRGWTAIVAVLALVAIVLLALAFVLRRFDFAKRPTPPAQQAAPAVAASPAEVTKAVVPASLMPATTAMAPAPAANVIKSVAPAPPVPATTATAPAPRVATGQPSSPEPPTRPEVAGSKAGQPPSSEQASQAALPVKRGETPKVDGQLSKSTRKDRSGTHGAESVTAGEPKRPPRRKGSRKSKKAKVKPSSNGSDLGFKLY